MKTFSSVIAAALCLAASPLAVTPAAAEYLFYRNYSVLDDHREFGVPLSRLDRDDLARERARVGAPAHSHAAGRSEASVPGDGRGRKRVVPDLLVVLCR